MDRSGLLHLASLLGGRFETRPNDIHVPCPFAPSARVGGGHLAHSGGYDRKLGFSIKIDPQGASTAYCHGCAAGGNLLRLLEQANADANGAYADAVAFVAENDKSGLEGAFARLRRQPLEHIDRHSVGLDQDELEAYIAGCSRQVHQYVVDRGLVRRDVEKHMLGFDAELGRVVLPIWDERGRVVGATRRTVHPDVTPAYYDTAGLRKADYFYGEHDLDLSRRHVRLVEGPFDRVFASRVLPNVLAVMGAKTGLNKDGYSPKRLEKLRRWADTVTILFDPDKAGREAVYGWWTKKGEWIDGLREILRQFLVVKVGWLPEGWDPGEAGRRNPALLLEADRNARYLEHVPRPPKPALDLSTRRG
jgi:hypothetical protein